MATTVGAGLESYIRRNARERALNRLAQAELDARQIHLLAEQRMQALREQRRDQTAREIAGLRRRMMAQAELDAQAIRLKVRERVLTAAWDLVRQRLEQPAAPEQRRSSLARLIRDASERMGGGPLIVQVNPADRALLTADLLVHLTRELTASIGPTEIRVSDRDAPILGGVIVSRPDGRHVVDNSYDARLRMAQDVLRDEVSRRLSGAPPGGDACASGSAPTAAREITP